MPKKESVNLRQIIILLITIFEMPKEEVNLKQTVVLF